MRKFLGLFLIAAILAPAASASAGAKKILLIGAPPDHGYGTHMYMHESRLLAKILKQTPGVETVVSNGWPKDKSVLEGLTGIVLYTPPVDAVIKDDDQAEFQALLKSGVGYAAIHWATATADVQKSDAYIDILGGCFNFAFKRPPLAVTKEKLVQVDPSHPISRGWAPFPVRDEWYLSVKHGSHARPLARVVIPPNPAQLRPEPIDLLVTWVADRADVGGKGRSFGTTMAHFHDNFGIEGFRKMIVNGILWTNHVEIPAAGTPVMVDDHDLVLPPPPQKKK